MPEDEPSNTALSYEQEIAGQARPAGRPDHYEGLLFRPVADDPAASGCYHHWEFDHGQSQRFYIGGLRWFRRTTGIDRQGTLAAVGQRASEVCKAETGWAAMPNSLDLWDACAPPQFTAATKVEPVFFQKAALVILACELALKMHLESGKPTVSPVLPEDIYGHMSIIPAVWNINDFDPAFLSGLIAKRPSAEAELLRAAGQEHKKLPSSMAAGHTVTWPTALAFKTQLEGPIGVRSGNIRAKPGKHLGKKAASKMEQIDAD